MHLGVLLLQPLDLRGTRVDDLASVLQFLEAAAELLGKMLVGAQARVVPSRFFFG
ncbi:hypothetical protein ACFCW6_03940 [Streptomyces sp. NPDC056333]|uniref:hypothetical protein n=1 Tax=Streptomyces sp. NPDC056333 TaxID=3345786 RepID=UPI0035D5FFCA